MKKVKVLAMQALAFFYSMLNLTIATATMYSFFAYPLYAFSTLGIIVSYVVISVIQVVRFVNNNRMDEIDYSKTNQEIAKSIFRWNYLARLIFEISITKTRETKKQYVPRNETRRCFNTLNLMTSATRQDIKAAYRKLAKDYHPDTTLLEPVEARHKFNKLTECKDYLLTKMKEKNV